MLTAAILVIFPLCMAYAAFSDLLTMTIANRVSLLLVASFFLIAPFAGLQFYDVGNHVAAMLIVFVVCFGLFAVNTMGGGDAKLLSASALWFGLGTELLTFLILVTAIGGLLCLFILKARSPAGFYIMSRIPLTHNLTTAQGVPYGIAIGAAGLITYPDTAIMQQVMAQLAAG
ncbi:prepilin peptidase [Rhizobium sp. EC-SD404]|uniref:A24 family peptidase n=1 Tax=Rhizobium sp. EC-SD404 TaxID=2038389 RepID=UPI00125BAD6A|nr:prepilin peptidase [Rhizobium sp. EC-SD404]VVT30797.1 Peptidase [Rhizobium sp. EC-SD404]